MHVGVDMGCAVYGIGIRDRIPVRIASADTGKFSIESIELFSRRLGFLPDFLRHILSLIEYYSKAAIAARNIRPDLIHCGDNLVLPLGVLIKYLGWSRALVYDAHELESNKNGQSKIRGRFVFLIEKLLWRSLDALIVVSPSIAEWYRSNIGEKRSEVILNSPIIGGGDCVRPDYLRTMFGIPKHSTIFIYIGNIVKGRGLEVIVDAFLKVNASAYVVFLGNGELVDDLKCKCGGAKNILFHEAVAHDQVVPIAKSADFGLCLIEDVSLSDYFCLPNKLFEYLFAELPVVASNFPDISELVNGAGVGICVDVNVNSIKSSVDRILNSNLAFKVDLALLGGYEWAAQAEKLRILYAELLGEAGE
jgi:glycosyltransferase involved in cell wall biosynthesis